MSIVDLGARRFQGAANASEVSSRDTVAEALRRLDAGEWRADSIVLIGLETDPDDGGTTLEMMHGGPANTNERLAMYVRATDLALRNMTGDR